MSKAPTALVTGASSGIGKAIYNGLILHNFLTYGLSRNGPDFSIDVSKLTEDDFDAILNFCEPVNLLVNCAGIMPLDESKREREIFDTNFWGTYDLMTKLHFDSEKAVIINIASVSGMIAEPDVPIYAASKAAVISVTKSLAKKWAPHIRVNSISPGFFETNLAPDPPKELTSQIPMGRVAKPDEILETVLSIWYSPYMTGTNIVLDGGVSL